MEENEKKPPAGFLERMKERQIAKTTSKRGNDNQRENYDSTFAAKEKQIMEKIDAAKTQSADALGEYFEQVQKDIISLQEYFATNASTLGAYDQRRSQCRIEELNSLLQRVRDELAPRKRFKFQRKQEEPKTLTETSVASPKKEAIVVTPISHQRRIGNAANLAAQIGRGQNDNEKLGLSPNISGGDFVLENLAGCKIAICDHLTSLHIISVQNSTIFCGPVSGSVFIENCTNSIVFAMSRQVRIHNSSECQFYLKVQSNPIIEDCSAITFGPYKFHYEGINDHAKESAMEFDETANKWSQIDDFKWIKKSIPSPNFKLQYDAPVVNFQTMESFDFASNTRHN